MTNTSKQSVEDYPYDTWFDALKALVRQYEDENDDLEAVLEGTMGFVSLFTKGEESDVSRGAITAVYQGVYDTIEEVGVDDELVEMQYGEVTPESVSEAMLDQIDEHTYLSDPLRSNIRERIEERVRKNMRRRA